MTNALLVWLAIIFFVFIFSFFLPSKQKEVRNVALVVLLVITAMKISILFERFLLRQEMNDTLRYWVVEGPGGGLLGQLPSVIFVILIGKYFFKKSVGQQWGGKFIPKSQVLGYGLVIGIFLSFLTLGLAYFTNSGSLYFHLSISSVLVNLFTNLYEEIIARGLLLQVVKDSLGPKSGMAVSSLIFGLLHGYGAKGIYIALISWLMAFAILKTRNLWSGWLAHQSSDMIIDSFLH